MPTFLFLLQDYEALERAIKDMENRISVTIKDAGESAREDANSWHDNFAYEQGVREATMYSDRIRELIQIRNSAQVITPESNTGRAFLGRTVTIQNLQTQENTTFQIGSFWIMDGRLGVISYASPLAKLIQGARVNDIRSGNIGGQNKSFKIVKIE